MKGWKVYRSVKSLQAENPWMNIEDIYDLWYWIMWNWKEDFIYIDKVFYQDNIPQKDVRDSLINHDWYSEDIILREEKEDK